MSYMTKASIMRRRHLGKENVETKKSIGKDRDDKMYQIRLLIFKVVRLWIVVFVEP